MNNEQLIDETIAHYLGMLKPELLQDISDLIDQMPAEEQTAVEEAYFSGEEALVEGYFELLVRPHAVAYLGEECMGTELEEARLGNLVGKINRADAKPDAKVKSSLDQINTSLKKRDSVKSAAGQINNKLAANKGQASDAKVKSSLSQINTKLADRKAASKAPQRVISIPKRSAMSKAAGAVKGALGAVKDKVKQHAPGVLSKIGSAAKSLLKGGAKLAGKAAVAGAKVAGKAAVGAAKGAAAVAGNVGDVAKIKMREKHPFLSHALFGKESEREASAKKAITGGKPAPAAPAKKDDDDGEDSAPAKTSSAPLAPKLKKKRQAAA